MLATARFLLLAALAAADDNLDRIEAYLKKTTTDAELQEIHNMKALADAGELDPKQAAQFLGAIDWDFLKDARFNPSLLMDEPGGERKAAVIAELRDLVEECQKLRASDESGYAWAPGLVFPCFEDEATCTIEKKLGNGQFGEVFTVSIAFRALDDGADAADRAMWALREPVLANVVDEDGGVLRAAIKTQTGPAIRESGASLGSVLAEALSWMSLPPHPDVVDILHTEVLRGDVVFFAELVEGSDLEKLLGSSTPKWAALAEEPALKAEAERLRVRLSFAHQMASGLAHMHANGLYHFDVKPANTMVGLPPDGTADLKVCDFGMARLTGGQTMELPGGTRLYMPPERTDGTGGSSCDAAIAATELEEVESGLGRRGMPKCSMNDGYALAITILEMW